MSCLRWPPSGKGPGRTEVQAQGWRREKNRQARKLFHTQFIVFFSCDRKREGGIFISQWDTQHYPWPSEESTSYSGGKQRHTCLKYWQQVNSLLPHNVQTAGVMPSEKFRGQQQELWPKFLQFCLWGYVAITYSTIFCNFSGIIIFD